MTGSVFYTRNLTWWRVSSIVGMYPPAGDPVKKAELFMNGRSQAVRLPKEFRMPGFDAAAAEVSGRVAARLERSGVRIGPRALLIGAHALAQGAALLTSNADEFARIERLSVVDSRADR